MLSLGPSPRNTWHVDADRCDLRRRRSRGPGWEIDAHPQDLILDPDRTGLLVVDMQNDFCHPNGWLASIGVDVTPDRAPIDPLVDLLPVMRDAGAPVIWVNWGNRPDRANLPPAVLHVYNPDGYSTGLGDPLSGAGRVLETGSWGAANVDELPPAAGDITAEKYRISGFWGTQLDSILRNLDLTTLLFAGVNVDQCVMATLLDAGCIGYDCILLTDCAATTSPPFCWDATIYNVHQCVGFTARSDTLRKAIG